MPQEKNLIQIVPKFIGQAPDVVGPSPGKGNRFMNQGMNEADQATDQLQVKQSAERFEMILLSDIKRHAEYFDEREPPLVYLKPGISHDITLLHELWKHVSHVH